MPTDPIEFFWYRIFEDGRAEFEFDLETGKPNLWGSVAPPGIVEFGWHPMTPDLALKIEGFGEEGHPVRALPVVCKLLPGEIPVIYRDRSIQQGAKVHCKVCNGDFLSSVPPTICPHCETEQPEGSPVFDVVQANWRTVIFCLGVAGRFIQRFDSHGIVTE